MSVELKYSTLRERDMDLILAQSIAADKGFCKIFVDETDLKGREFSTISVEISRSDTELGESDITVLLDFSGKRIGLLIEDKVDAGPQPEQYERYIKRGEKGKENQEYDEYRVFICCPEKYRASNDMAKKYNHFVSYESCQQYFEKNGGSNAGVIIQQFQQAIEKVKSVSNTTLNEKANAFFRKYIEWKENNYKELELTTKESANGYWAHYRTNFGNTYIYHKISKGEVQLIFSYTKDYLVDMQAIARQLREYGIRDVSAVPASGSSALSIKVPELNIEEDFEKCDENDLSACLRAIQTLTDFAKFAELCRKLGCMKKK